MNLGGHLRVRVAMQPGAIAPEMETDLAEVAVVMYQKPE